MTAYDPARPRYTLPFAGKNYELLGTFGLVEAVEHATKLSIGVVTWRIVNGLPASDPAKVIAAILTACQYPMSAEAAGEKLWDRVGLTGDDNDAIRLHLFSFLSICLAPPGQRERKDQEAGELLGRLASGSSTAKSASESSGGDPASSGPLTPGA